MTVPAFDTVVINGSVGTGKTTTADALGDLLQQAGIPGAVIDVDWLRRSWPSPPGDPFRGALALENLAAVATNFRRAGARVLVAATVVEDLDGLREHRTALSSRSLLHVRLTADAEVVASRLARRHDDDEAARQWHLARHPELARVLDGAGFSDDLRLDTTRQTPAEVASAVFAVLVGASDPSSPCCIGS